MRHQLRISRREPSTRLGCVRDPFVFYVATQERRQSIFGFYSCICSLYHAFLSLHYNIHTPHAYMPAKCLQHHSYVSRAFAAGHKTLMLRGQDSFA